MNYRGRIADLDQQTAKLRDHLWALDVKAAQTMGLDDEAARLAEEQVEAELSKYKLNGCDVPGGVGSSARVPRPCSTSSKRSSPTG